jgi:ubiquinone biosynthesis protein UbiJ
LSLVGPGAEDRLRGSSIRIAGDAEVAQRFRDLLQHTQPDFEEELSRVVGDVAAHQVANIARGFFDWGRKAADSFSTNVAEYLQEEGRDVHHASKSRNTSKRSTSCAKRPTGSTPA